MSTNFPITFDRPLDFYITNVCNYSCPECNRFNNYRFTGNQKWQDYKNIHRAWSERITPASINIMGGEPLLNPYINEWLCGLRELWPTIPIKIVSNGSRLNKVAGLYDTLRTLTQNYNPDTYIQISMHDRSMEEEILRDVILFLDEITVYNCRQYTVAPQDTYMQNQMLDNWKEYYNAAKDSSWAECKSFSDFYKLPQYVQDECSDELNISPTQWFKRSIQKQEITLHDINGVKVELWMMDFFERNAINESSNGTLSLLDNDSYETYGNTSLCGCHHMSKGKLYVCPIVDLIPEFVSQGTYNVHVSDDRKQVLESYVPLSAEDDYNTMKEFIHGMIGQDNPMPQCSFCPTSRQDIVQLSKSAITEKINKK